ncbi:MAG: hypothetical protein Q8Q31_04020 [Nanoarchaeota archaeon]|nr:hypothetical protein [Nanoarchaeota archaeon]
MNEKIKELPKGLTLEDGVSHEIAIGRLAEAGIKYEVKWDKMDSTTHYFRASNITVGLQGDMPFQAWLHLDKAERRKILESAQDKVTGALGFPHNLRSGIYSYYATYVIGRNFDLSSLSGAVTFNKGRLVERVLVYFE